jgi:hypothetical protein
MQQIAGWLEKLGMSEYAERFAENRRRVPVWSSWFGRRRLEQSGGSVWRRPGSSGIWRAARARKGDEVGEHGKPAATRSSAWRRPQRSPWLAVSEFALAPFALRC